MVADIPRIGFGTYDITDPDTCRESVRRALEVGYRHVDTAQGYDNEGAVGTGIEAADLDREGVFLATKLSTRNLAYEDVLRSTAESRRRLGVETIDLLYVHWPIRTYDPDETLAALAELQDDGHVRHIGLSNFTVPLLDEALEVLDRPILAHQVEMHPLLQQSELHEYAIEADHWLVAYSPVAKGQVAEIPVIQEIAAARDATPGQVSLAWLLAKENVVPIPKSAGPHIEENYAALDLDLREEEIERIDGIDEERRLVDFDAAPWN